MAWPAVSQSSEEEGSGESSSEEEEEEEEEEKKEQHIADMTQTNLVNLRRTIYLTIMSALDFEEAGHKLLKIGIQPGQEIEVATMILECCSNEKMYNRFYGLLAQRFCNVKREYQAAFEELFARQYSIVHRLSTTGKIRNVSKFFAHLLSNDAISWAVLAIARITEDDTTSSSRIFLKFLFQELSEVRGPPFSLASLAFLFQDPVDAASKPGTAACPDRGSPPLAFCLIRRTASPRPAVHGPQGSQAATGRPRVCRVVRGPLSGGQRPQPALCHQLLHAHRPRRPHWCVPALPCRPVDVHRPFESGALQPALDSI